MSTNSRIGILEPDGSVTSIYCHWDGYPDHNGRILLYYYEDEAKIRTLLAQGDRSCLGQEPDPADSFGRNQSGKPAPVNHPADDWPRCGEEYEYVFVPGKGWTYRALYPEQKFQTLDSKAFDPLNPLGIHPPVKEDESMFDLEL
jgi:hypothetical protein